MEKLGVNKEISDQLVEIIKIRFKEEDIIIAGTLKLKSFETDGVDIIRKALVDAETTDKAITMSYKGGGSYNIEVTSNNYGGDLFIYDKCIKFNGDFPTREFMENFKTWKD